MGEVGVCINVTGTLPSAGDLAALGLMHGWLRTPVQGPLSLLDRLNSLPASVQVVVTLNNECAEVRSDWSGWTTALRTLVEQFGARVRAVACGNELDALPNVSAEFAADLVRQALPILRPHNIRTIAPSVVGPDWPAYLNRLVMACGTDQPDYYDAHFYGKGFAGLAQEPNFGTVAAGIETARVLSGNRPIALTEGGVKIGDAGGPTGQADYVRRWVRLVRSLSADNVPFGTYFALYDQVGAPNERGDHAFGLVAEDGQRRPAWSAFAEANGAEPGSSTAGRAAGAAQPVPTLVSLAESLPNPHLLEQVATWQRLRRQNREDPNDWEAFRAFEKAIGAPDPGPTEAQGFHSS